MQYLVKGNVNEITEEDEEDSGEESELVCHYCDTVLGLEYDYTCIECGTLTCDNHNELCQADDDERSKDCDFVSCYVCFEQHMKYQHSDSVRVVEYD